MTFQWLDDRVRMALPIDEKLGQIIDTILRNRVVIVRADTGSGKTVRLPQALHFAFPDEMIYVTEPRRTAVRTSARRVSFELGTALGTLAGYKLRGEVPQLSSSTKIVFRIDQGLSNLIRREGKLPAGVIMIDEAHVRSTSIDILLGLIRETLDASPDTRVVITSATIDVVGFKRLFPEAAVCSVEGRCYPVTVEPTTLMIGEHHTQGAARAAAGLMREFVSSSLFIEGAGVVTGGTALVLLPGKEDIRQVVAELERVASEELKTDRFEVLTLHGESDESDERRVFADLKPKTLRFVVGTEVLRSSVTLPHVVAVVDSLQVKRLIVNEHGVTHFTKIAISDAESKQAAGRAGRTQPGIYIPVSFGSEYSGLQKFPTPEIVLGPISLAYLTVASVGRNIETFPLIDRPAPEKIAAAKKRLQGIGAIDEAGAITELGTELLRYSLDPERAYSLLKARDLGVLPEAVILLATLEVEGFFGFASKDQRRSDSLRMQLSEVQLTELLHHLTPVRSWEMIAGSLFWTDTRQADPIDRNDPVLRRVLSLDGRGGASIELGPRTPLRIGIEKIVRLSHGLFASGSGNDLVAIVNAYRRFKAVEADISREMASRPQVKNKSEQVTAELKGWCARYFLNYARLRQTETAVKLLLDDLTQSGVPLSEPVNRLREFDVANLTKSYIAGNFDQIGVSNGSSGWYAGPIGEFRIANDSTCSPESPIAVAARVERIPTARGSHFLLAKIAAPVKVKWIEEMLPRSVTRESSYAYDMYRMTTSCTTTLLLSGIEIETRDELVTDPVAIATAIGRWLTNGYVFEPAPLEAVVRQNAELVRRMRDANQRAGRKVFPVDSTDALGAFYASKLVGVTSHLDVTGDRVAALRLPFDERVFTKIFEDSPNTIVVNGTSFSLEYQNGEPRLVLRDSRYVYDGTNSNVRALPNEVMRTPGGREIRFIVKHSLIADIVTYTGSMAKQLYASLSSRESYLIARRDTSHSDREITDLSTRLPGVRRVFATNQVELFYAAEVIDFEGQEPKVKQRAFLTRLDAELVQARAEKWHAQRSPHLYRTETTASVEKPTPPSEAPSPRLDELMRLFGGGARVQIKQ